MIDGFGRKEQKRETTFVAIVGNIIHEKYNTEHEPLLTENVVNTKQEYMKLVYAQMFLNAYKYISLGI